MSAVLTFLGLVLDMCMKKKSSPSSFGQLVTQHFSDSASLCRVAVFCIALSQEISGLIRSFVLESFVLAKQGRNFYGQLVYIKSQQQIIPSFA